jgi:hypothetical protein
MRGALVGFALVAAAAACVDLFHSTDFDTLCTLHPLDPSCNGSADAGDAAQDTKRPIPDFCTFSSADAQKRAKHVCAWLGACEGPLGATKLGPCIAAATAAYDCNANPGLRPQRGTLELWGCLLDAVTCDAVDACIFSRVAGACPGLGPGQEFTTCDEQGVRVACSPGDGGRPSAVEPCLLRGQTCTKRNDSAAACTGNRGAGCSTQGCIGTSAVVCGTGGDNIIDEGVDCVYYGRGECHLTDAGPTCLPLQDAGACVSPDNGLTACSGTNAHLCAQNADVDINCFDLGAPCRNGATPLRPDEACGADASTCDDSCDGTGQVKSCNNGVAYSIGCSDYGLGPCHVLPSGLAACTRP